MRSVQKLTELGRFSGHVKMIRPSDAGEFIASEPIAYETGKKWIHR
jgi:hypothetical protein